MSGSSSEKVATLDVPVLIYDHTAPELALITLCLGSLPSRLIMTRCRRVDNEQIGGDGVGVVRRM